MEMNFKKFGDFENRMTTIYSEAAILKGHIEDFVDDIGLTPEERKQYIRNSMERMRVLLANMENF